MNISNLYQDCPNILKDFLFYMGTVKGRSTKTVNAYYIDLKTFFRFIKHLKNLVPKNINFKDINIDDIDLNLIKSISIQDVYAFLYYTEVDRKNNTSTRSRKSSCIRSFFKYITNIMKLLDENPVKDLEVATPKKSLPKYLTLEESINLLNNIDGDNKDRDYCMINLFLNCGMRLSELANINLQDIRENTIRITGKGNKQRMVYLNQSCIDALSEYLKVRNKITNIKEKNALFISRNGNRVSNRQIQRIVENNLKKSGLDNMGYSVHKLRHTAATLMYQHGNVDIRILKELLGHVNLGTTEIYTHVSNKQLETAAASNPLSNIKKLKKQK